MRKMRPLQSGQTTTLMTSTFLGYHHADLIGDGEMYDMTNMSSDAYPSLTVRKQRKILSMDPSGSTPVPLTGIHGRDQLVFVRGSQVYYNGVPVSGLNTLSTDSTMVPKKIVSMGAYVCIWPDKVYFNTLDQSDCGPMGRSFSTSGENLSIMLCRADGSQIDNVTVSGTAPANPGNGDYWIDNSGAADVLMQWDGATAEWIEIGTPYVKIGGSGTSFGAGLKEYDAVELTGLEAANGASAKIQAQVAALNGSFIVYQCSNDYIVVAGMISQTQEQLADNTVHCNITVPNLDYICESNNRLWGCRYGLVNGEMVNEIKACKLGDFRNWNCYMGLASDSYTASVGTDGPFTGAITQRGYPVFFKENCIHRVSGNTPASFAVQTTIARGVQRDSWRSVAVVSENIYYKARNAVMVYDGNMPVSISEKFGNTLYYNARGGVCGYKYYLSMCDASGTWTMFVYDTRYGIWHKEDQTQALGFGTVEDELFFIKENNNTLCSVNGTMLSVEGDSSVTTENRLNWTVTFDMAGVGYFPSSYRDDPTRIRNSKYISLFKIRLKLGAQANMYLGVQYDNSNAAESFGPIATQTNAKTFILPVAPKRCDHFRIQLFGSGDATVYDLSRILEVGGDGIGVL